MLEFIGLSVRIKWIQDAVVSLWVAVLEGLLDTRLPQIIRDPETATHRGSRIHNAQIVIDTLESLIIKMPLSHIKAEHVVDGSERTLVYLADIFWQLYLQLSGSSDDRTLPIGQEPAQAGQTGQTQPEDSSREATGSNGSALGPFQTFPSESSIQVDTSHTSLKHLSDESNLQSASKATEPAKGVSFQDDMIITEPATPATLRISHADTPHLKALKLKQTRLFKEKAVQQKRAADASKGAQSKLARERTRHLATIQPVQLRHKKHTPTARSRDATTLSSGTSGTTGTNSNPTGIANSADDLPKTRPEETMDAYINHLVKAVPILGQIPPEENERAWKSQIKLWKAALDDRLWTQKVVLVHLLTQRQQLGQLEDKYPLEHIAEMTKSAQLAEFRRRQIAAQKKAKAEIEDRFRRLKRMQRKHHESEAEALRLSRKEKLKEEALLKGMMDDYIRQQRETILQERKLEKEMRDLYAQQEERTRVAQEAYLNDQIAMLREEMQETKQKEAILQQAQQEAM